MSAPVLVLVEHAAGAPDGVSLEAVTLARGVAEATGAGLEAVLVGAGADAAAAMLAGRGLAAAHVVTHDALDGYAPRAWGAAIAQLVAAREAAVAVAPGTERGNEVMAYAGAIAGLPMVANVLTVTPGAPLAVTRQRWGGSLVEEATLATTPSLLTVAPHAVEAVAPDGSSAPAVRPFEPELAPADLAVRVTGRIEPERGTISLADAKVVVGGGRGVGSGEAFAILEELAGLLGGAVGGSRVVTSNGWRPHADQIGQTGLRIAPDIYIACGISGAIQHIVGCAASKTILAINKDPDAPIMARAQYAVIGDLHDVVPAISAEIRRARGG